MWASAKRQDPLLKVAVVYSWPWIRHFVSSQTADWSHNCKGNDEECIEKVRVLPLSLSCPLYFSPPPVNVLNMSSHSILLSCNMIQVL